MFVAVAKFLMFKLSYWDAFKKNTLQFEQNVFLMREAKSPSHQLKISQGTAQPFRSHIPTAFAVYHHVYFYYFQGRKLLLSVKILCI